MGTLSRISRVNLIAILNQILVLMRLSPNTPYINLADNLGLLRSFTSVNTLKHLISRFSTFGWELTRLTSIG